MRNPEPDHKTVYVRFHHNLDEWTERFIKKSGMKRATAISWIIERYFTGLSEKHGSISQINEQGLGFLPQGEAFFLVIGRSDAGRAAGKRTIITIDKATERNLNYLATKFGFTPSQFRTEILVKYYIENHIDRE